MQALLPLKGHLCQSLAFFQLHPGLRAEDSSQAFQVTVTESQGSISGILGFASLCGLLPLTVITNASLFY